MKSFDTIVIGGGITGATATNHLTAAGYETLMLEAGDFGAGTTSRTSRLQYCGLAYLNGFERLTTIGRHPLVFLERLTLARRSMRERTAFVRASRERVQEVDFYLPIYAGDAATRWKMKAGFKALEMMDAGGEGLNYRYLDAGAARNIPMLTGASARGALLGAIHYVEYQYNWPERICLDAVMNAAGAWVDDIARASRINVAQMNQGEKGTNIAVKLPPEFAGQGLQTLARDGSPFYLIPWGRLHYAGPVNSAAVADRNGFVAQETEIAALLEEIGYLFPHLALQRNDVVYSWAGVRPRTYVATASSGGPGLQLHMPEKTGMPGYFVYTGGLLMMHGHIGREVAKGVARHLTPSSSRQAVKVGPRALAIPDQRGVITSSDDISYSVAALNHMTASESVMTLEDLMFRRSRFGWNECLGTDTVEDVAEAVRDTAGWSTAETSAQIAAYHERLTGSYKFRG